MRTLLAVALGASLGAPARYLVDVALRARFGQRLPWGTLAVNLLGSAAAGVVAGLGLPREAAGLLAVGFLGSFTTASTLAWELLERAGTGWRAAPGLLALHVFPGLALAGLGLAAGRAAAGAG